MKSRRLCLFVISAVLGGCAKESETHPAAVAQAPGSNPAAAPNASNIAKDSAKPSTVNFEQRSAQAQPTVYSAHDLAKVLDLAALPVLKNTKFSDRSSAAVSAQAPGHVPEVAEFYQSTLKNLGWTEISNPDQKTTEEYASFHLTKEGHLLDLSVSKFDGQKDKGPLTMVSMTFHGNFDTRNLPRPDGSEALYSGQPISSYVLTQDVGQASEWVEKTLAGQGWQRYSAPDTQEAATSDQQTLTFRKQGYSLTVYISNHPVRKKAFLQYMVVALAHELPTPAGATKVEFSEERWILRCQVPGDIKTVGAFYQKTMPELGYKPLPSEEPQSTYWNLRFGTEQGDIVMVQASRQDDKTSKVFINGIPAAVVAKLNEDEKKKAP
jgi:hypothetical protein